MCSILFSLEHVEKQVFYLCSFTSVEKPICLFCFRSQVLNNHVFIAFSLTSVEKNIGLIVLPIKNKQKGLVLLSFQSKLV